MFCEAGFFTGASGAGRSCPALFYYRAGKALIKPAGSMIELSLSLASSDAEFDNYYITPKADIATGETGGVNWIKTPSISYFTGGKVYKSVNIISSPNPLAAFVKGAWEHTVEMMAEATPTPSTYVIQLVTAPASLSIKKDGVEIGAVTSAGTYASATKLLSFHSLLDSSGLKSLSILGSITDNINGGSRTVSINDAATDRKTLDSINRLKITNDIGATILKGTKLGSLRVFKGTITEIFS